LDKALSNQFSVIYLKIFLINPIFQNLAFKKNNFGEVYKDKTLNLEIE